MNPAWLILIPVCSLCAAEVQDLGVISARRGVVFGNASTRPGFVNYRVECLPETAPTNLIVLTLKSDLLRVEDIPSVPSGRGLMGVRAIYSDGEESEVALFRYDLRRSKPPAPSVTSVGIGTTNHVDSSLSNELQKIQRRRVIPAPPIPSGFFAATNMGWYTEMETQDRIMTVILTATPLPDGTNRSYSQHLDSLADRSSYGKRRSE